MSFTAADRVARRDHLRALIRRAADRADIDLTALGRRLGYAETRWRTMMARGELACLASADDLVLTSIIGPAVLEAKAREAGYRLVPETATVAKPGDMIAAAGEAMASVGVLLAGLAAAIPDGIDPVEARQLQAGIDEARRKLSQLEARVGAAVVDPLRRSGR